MNSLGRRIILLLVFIAITSVIYFGSVMSLDIYKKMEKMSLKKEISVKPKNIKEKLVLVNPGSPNTNEFTFFDTLDDSSMSIFIDLNGIIVSPKIYSDNKTSYLESTPNNSFNRTDSLKSKKALNLIALKNEFRNEGESLLSGYVLQVGSFKSFESAGLLKNQLTSKGYPAFVHQASTSGESEGWHRVIIGRFAEKETAMRLSIMIKQVEKIESILKLQKNSKLINSP